MIRSLWEIDALDSKFLKFWGQFLLDAAEGQDRFEQLSAWMEKGVTGMNEITDMIRRFYGLAAKASPGCPTGDTAHTRTAITDFQASLDGFAKAWGWVSETTYLQLQGECTALRRQVAEQEEIISTLRALLDEKGMGHMEFFQRLQNVAQDQNRQFQEFMKSLRDA